MNIIGQVDSLWRYPVKSMRGEELDEAFVGFSGVYGDRLFAFRSAARPKGFPYLTGRQQQEMLRYRPRFRHAAKAAQPPNIAEAKAIAPGATALHADPADLIVDVETPSAEVVAIDDAMLIRMLREGISREHTLTLLRSDRAMTDCRPVSLFSIQTAQQLGREIGVTADKRRFRANIYLDLNGAAGFAEDALVGRSLRIGSKTVISILELAPPVRLSRRRGWHRRHAGPEQAPPRGRSGRSRDRPPDLRALPARLSGQGVGYEGCGCSPERAGHQHARATLAKPEGQ
jgi:hypothetical protein